MSLALQPISKLRLLGAVHIENQWKNGTVEFKNTFYVNTHYIDVSVPLTSFTASSHITTMCQVELL